MPTNAHREKDLIKRAQQGNAYAFETLINDYYMTMYKIAYKWCGNREDAEDITQNASIKLVRALDSFHFDAAFSSWLYRLVINAAKDWQKSQHRHISADGVDIEQERAKDSKPEQQVYTQQIMSLIEDLPQKEKEALIFISIEGMSHKQAANQLGCSEGTVSWYIHEARKKLAERMAS